MASEWPEFKLDHTWPAFCWLEGDVADEIASGWMEWLPEHETTVDEDIGNAARVYLSVDAARAWQAFRDWLNGSVEQWNELLANACTDARGDGFQEGYDRAMHDVENA